MILRIEGNAVEIIEFFNATVEAAIGFMDGVPGERTESELRVTDHEKAPALSAESMLQAYEKLGRPRLSKKAGKPYSGGQGDPKEKADRLTSNIKKEKAPQETKAVKARGRWANTRKATIGEIREEVPLEECSSIPEAIEAIMEICKTSGAHLGRLLGIDKSVFSKARNGEVSKRVKEIFIQHFPELKLDDKAAIKKTAGDPSPSNIKEPVKAVKTTPQKTGRIPAGTGSHISLEDLKKVDLNDCGSIADVINKLQLESNVTGSRLAELLEIHASDLSKARKGITPPFIERAFKQYLQFPANEKEQENAK